MQAYESDLKAEIAIRKKQNRKFGNFEIKTFILQISSALKFAISQNIYHRDIKPANILISKTNKINGF